MTRAAVRDGIAQYFGGTTFDAADQVYRPTPLAAQGLAAVSPYYAERFPDEVLAIKGLAADRNRGAVMCVHLAQYTESRDAGGAYGGIIAIPYQVQLYLWYLALGTVSVQAAQADLDDLVHAVIDRLRADPTLGETVVQAGEGSGGISVNMPPPVYEPDRYTRQDVVINFQAELYPFHPAM